jgi:hypothetical protein
MHVKREKWFFVGLHPVHFFRYVTSGTDYGIKSLGVKGLGSVGVRWIKKGVVEREGNMILVKNGGFHNLQSCSTVTAPSESGPLFECNCSVFPVPKVFA